MDDVTATANKLCAEWISKPKNISCRRYMIWSTWSLHNLNALMTDLHTFLVTKIAERETQLSFSRRSGVMRWVDDGASELRLTLTVAMASAERENGLEAAKTHFEHRVREATLAYFKEVGALCKACDEHEADCGEHNQ